MRPKINIFYYVLLSCVMAFFLLCVLLAVLATYEKLDGDFGSVQWRHGGDDPDGITVIVKDRDGAPVPGVEVMSTSSSGDSHREHTSADGRAIIKPGEDDVLALTIDGRKLMDKDNLIESWFAPTISPQGLVFNIRLQRK
jgi:hypothetical protein